MNFVHPLRSPRAPAEGSMERGHIHGFPPSAGAAPCADFIGYPIGALRRVRNDEARCTVRCASGNDTNRR